MSAQLRRRGARRHDDGTPDSHRFPTRRYDLVKEFLVALFVMAFLTALLAAVFSSPDDKAITLQQWARQAPDDLVATAAAELAGTSTTASYGAPYNTASPGQDLGPLALQRWAGVRIAINAAKDLVIDPVSTMTDTDVIAAVTTWNAARPNQQTAWAGSYSDALAAAPNGDRTAVAAGDYGPVPALTNAELTLASSGALEGLLAAKDTFYMPDSTKPLLLLSDGSYLEGKARDQSLGGDQWGMMNETGNYPGQPWLWGYTFWYQVSPFSTSGNADALVWGLMAALSVVVTLVPWIPGLRRIPQAVKVHRLIWRKHGK